MDNQNSAGNESTNFAGEQQCPACGYCPHCGRRNLAPYPYPWGGTITVPGNAPYITYTTTTLTGNAPIH